MVIGNAFVDDLGKLGQLGLALLAFFAVLGLIFFFAGKANGKTQNLLAKIFMLGPAGVLVTIGLIIPLIQTIVFSFKDANSIKYVGLSNYKYIFTSPVERTAIINTLIWRSEEHTSELQSH